MKLSRIENSALMLIKTNAWIGCEGELDLQDKENIIAKSLFDKGLISIVYHPETDYTSITLRPISVRINIAGREFLYEMTFAGIGAYPYPCIAKDKHPNDAIYKDETGGWDSLRDYEYNSETQEYFLPYALI